MKLCLLFNPKAGSAGQIDALRDRLAARFAVTVRAAGPDDDLGAIAAEAARGGFDLLAVAGGDGTVHQVVNGLGPDFPKVPLAVLPLGTGNDLCRTLAVPLDPLAAADALARHIPRRRFRSLDVARVEGGRTGFLANAATGGFSGRVATDVTAELKEFWGPLAYLRGAVGTAADRPTFRVTLRLDDCPPETIDALNVVVANARTAAGGLTVAPTADPEDGKLDVVVIRAGAVLDVGIVAARLMAGDYHKDENVFHRRAARVEIDSDPPMPFSVDGELSEGPRYVFTVVPKALSMVVGRGYRHNPRGGVRGVGQRLFGLLAAVLRMSRRLAGGYPAGLAVAVLATFAFLLLARGVTTHEWDDLNHSVRASIQSTGSSDRTQFAHAFTTLGGVGGISAVGGAIILTLLARRRYLDGATLLVVLLGAGVLELILKGLFGVARPEPLEGITPFGGYSFPSGHALRSACLYGVLAGLLVEAGPRTLWRWAAAAGLVAVAVGVGWTRVYLNAHWPTDVLGAWLTAATWVACCLVARHHAKLRRPPTADGVRP